MPGFRIGEFRMCFYADDHPPAHVHCINGDGAVVVNLYTLEVIREKGRIKPRDSARAVKLVDENRNLLLVEWNLFDMRRKEN